MLVTLGEAKLYLRVDHDEEDSLIMRFLQTAKSLVMEIGRMDTEEELEEEADTNRIAIEYCLSYLYENRNTADFKKLKSNLRSVLSAQREDVI